MLTFAGHTDLGRRLEATADSRIIVPAKRLGRASQLPGMFLLSLGSADGRRPRVWGAT
jgi:hypothetical protein